MDGWVGGWMDGWDSSAVKILCLCYLLLLRIQGWSFRCYKYNMINNFWRDPWMVNFIALDKFQGTLKFSRIFFSSLRNFWSFCNFQLLITHPCVLIFTSDRTLRMLTLPHGQISIPCMHAVKTHRRKCHLEPSTSLHFMLWPQATTHYCAKWPPDLESFVINSHISSLKWKVLHTVSFPVFFISQSGLRLSQ